VMSVGALLDEHLLRRVKDAAEKSGRRVIIPSGALGGVDALKAAKLGGIRSVTLTTRKHPDSLRYSPYFKGKIEDLTGSKEPYVVFEGTAEEAVKAFPASVNVSATLSLAGIGGRETKVRIVADPKVSENIHEVEVEGGFGRMKVIMENVKHHSNPKTSYLAVLSAIETLKSVSSTGVKVGT